MKRFSIKKLITVIAGLLLCFMAALPVSAASLDYSEGVLTIRDLEGSATLIHASYSGNALDNIEITEAENGSQTVTANAGDKFFLWDGTDSMRPLAPAVTIPDEPDRVKALVVYFSATGNTQRVAGYIAEAAAADIFELEPTDPYTSADLRWTDENSRVVYEYEHPDERDVKLVSTTVPDWDSYDTVFIGYPIWWGIAAWPVDGFVEANDFSGKTVIPFCTSSSSGIGESGQLLAEAAGTGVWQQGMRFRSGVTQSDVADWVNGLDL